MNEDEQTHLGHVYSEQRLDEATVLIEDAFFFRSIHHKLRPQSVLKLYRFYWSRIYQTFLTTIVAFQLLLIFVQHPSSISRTSDLKQQINRWTLPCSIQIIVEFVSLVIFYVDASFRVNFETISHRRSRFEYLLSGLLHQFQSRQIQTVDRRLFHRQHDFLGRSRSLGFIRMSKQSLIAPNLSSLFDTEFSSSGDQHSFLASTVLHGFDFARNEENLQQRSQIFRANSQVFFYLEFRFSVRPRNVDNWKHFSVTILLGIHVYFFSVIGMILFPPVRVKFSRVVSIRRFDFSFGKFSFDRRIRIDKTKDRDTFQTFSILCWTWSFFWPQPTIPMVFSCDWDENSSSTFPFDFSDAAGLFEAPLIHHLLRCFPDNRSVVLIERLSHCNESLVSFVQGLYCLMTLFTVIKLNTFKEYFTVSIVTRPKSRRWNSFDCRLLCKTHFFVVVWLSELVLMFCSISGVRRSTTNIDWTTKWIVLCSMIKGLNKDSSFTKRKSRSTCRVQSFVQSPIVRSVINRSNIPRKYRDKLLDVCWPRNRWKTTKLEWTTFLFKSLQKAEEESINLNWKTFSTLMLDLDADLLTRVN